MREVIPESGVVEIDFSCNIRLMLVLKEVPLPIFTQFGEYQSWFDKSSGIPISLIEDKLRTFSDKSFHINFILLIFNYTYRE